MWIPWGAVLQWNFRWIGRSKHRDKCSRDNPNSHKCHLIHGSWSIPYDDLMDIPSRLFGDCTFRAFVSLYINRFVDSARHKGSICSFQLSSYKIFFLVLLTLYISDISFWIDETDYARLRKLTPKMPRSTPTIHTSRITKRTRTWKYTSDSLPPSVTS